MKFCKTYQEYMRAQEQKKLPVVGFKKLKKIMKKCRRSSQFHKPCPDQCPLCDGTFFPSLLNEMSEIVGCFNQRAQKLLERHLASGFRKYILMLKGKSKRNHTTLIHEGRDLVTYALINAVAIRKILKKYDKIHYSKQGQLFKSQAQTMHKEILQSPWLIELMALHINLRETKDKSRKATTLFNGCCLTFKDGKPSLACELFDSIKIDIDLTCSICLDTVFDPVSLTCGHIFCYSCACSAASVTIVDGLKATHSKEKCPMCRGLAISHEHTYMFSAGDDKQVKCWDLEQNKVTMAVCGSGIGRVVTISSNLKQLYNLVCIFDCFYMLSLMLVGCSAQD